MAGQTNAVDEASVRRLVLWGVVFGALLAAAPFAFWWLEPATVHALAITLIAAVYLGFAVADGRPRVIVVEVVVAAAFILLAAVSITGPVWLLVVGYAGHGLKDLWQERHQYVAATRWWPPFCAAVDLVVAALLVLLLAAGVSLHR
jgi:hypothetical protein